MFLGCETGDLCSHYKDLHTFEEDKERNSEIKEGISLFPYFQQGQVFSICIYPQHQLMFILSY